MTSSSPYSEAMLDGWRGDLDAAYTIYRDDGWSQLVPAAAAFAGQPFNAIEQLALERASGRVLDVGAGVGRHSLVLQSRVTHVTSIEVEPELVTIMAERGVTDALVESIFTLASGEFDTILMLMNGFGLVGSLRGAAAFFEHAQNLLSPTGQILCDSLDVRGTSNPAHLAYQVANLRNGRPAGQMRFWIEYRGRRGKPFDWLHLDFDTLREQAAIHGWQAEKIADDERGHYLARLVYPQ